jgi:hypothetical protein
MAHQWHRGVLTASSWHGLEDVGIMADADDIIDAGERSGAWPIHLRRDRLITAGEGLSAPAEAVIADFREHPSAVLGVVGGRYQETTPESWRELVRAACAAGAKPTGAFALRDGRRVLATFEVGESQGLKNKLLLADSFDGSMRLTAGTTSICVVCANTLSAALSGDGDGMAKLRHTASLEEKVNILAEAIGETIRAGEATASTFETAQRTYLTAGAAKLAFDRLFPPAPADASARTITIAEKRRDEARIAARNQVNRYGNRPGNLATLWSAATYVVDRHPDGSTRETRGDSSMLESMLLGSRAQRIEEVRKIVEVVMADGTVEPMTITEAREHGVDDSQIGSRLLEEMLSDAAAK